MEDMKKLSESELENVSGGEYIPDPGSLTDGARPREDVDVWECFKCHNVRERFAKDHTFWMKNNECSCGGWYDFKGRKQ